MAKYYPSIEELTTVTNLLYCTENGCSGVFKSESNLNMHLAKSHKKEEHANLLIKQEEQDREYYCPETTCNYNSSKFFKTFKLLKQHYLKVHSSKDILCSKCNKGFPTESARNNHFEYCGVNFKCCDCEATYTCYDTLTTHGRRKKHKVMPKIHYKESGSATQVSIDETQLFDPILLPRAASETNLIMKKTMDQSSQTDLGRKSRKSIKRNHSIETQTSRNKYPQLCAETQTIGDFVPCRKFSDVSNSNISESIRKSINTQTAIVTSTTKSCNTSFTDDDLNFDDGKTTTLGTQTLSMLNSLSPDLSIFMNSSCQTSFNDSLDFDSNYYNNETQTDFILNSDFDLLTGLNNSNMYTQTTDISEYMEFNNMHTQTVKDDILRSVGSQTELQL